MDIANTLHRYLSQDEFDYMNWFATAFRDQYMLNDSTHQFDHFDEVLALMLELADYTDYPLVKSTRRMMIAAAYLHDLFAYHRDVHHLLAAEFVRTTEHELLARFTDEQRQRLAAACAEHRASYTGDYSSEFSELLSAADRGYPRDADGLIKSAYQFHKDRYDDTTLAYRKALAHVREKHGSNGYARYPDMYRRYFSVELDERVLEVDRLNIL